MADSEERIQQLQKQLREMEKQLREKEVRLVNSQEELAILKKAEQSFSKNLRN